MRTQTARFLLGLSVIVSLSGCYSNGQWSMPTWSWNSDANKHAATAGPTTSANTPQRPSSLGTATNSPAPGAGYMTAAPKGAVATGTPTSYPSTTSGYAAPNASSPYPSTQAQPTGYPTLTQPANYPSASAAQGAGYGGTPSAAGSYVAPQTGPYGSPASQASPVSPASYGAPAQYGSAAPPVPAAGAAYVASNPTTGYQNPIRPAAPSTDRYADPNAARAATTPERYETPTSVDRYPTGPVDRYKAAAAAVPSYAAPATDTRYADAAPTSGTPASMTPASGERYPASGSYAPAGNGYAPASTDYTPGANSYQPAGARPYTPPAGAYNPAANPNDPPAYRPGGTSDYVPKSSTESSNASTRPAVSSVDGNVRPVGYLR